MRRKSSSFSLQPQLEQVRQQKRRMPTPAVMATAKMVPAVKSEWARECMIVFLYGADELGGETGLRMAHSDCVLIGVNTFTADKFHCSVLAASVASQLRD